MIIQLFKNSTFIDNEINILKIFQRFQRITVQQNHIRDFAACLILPKSFSFLIDFAPLMVDAISICQRFEPACCMAINSL